MLHLVYRSRSHITISLRSFRPDTMSSNSTCLGRHHDNLRHRTQAHSEQHRPLVRVSPASQSQRDPPLISKVTIVLERWKPLSSYHATSRERVIRCLTILAVTPVQQHHTNYFYRNNNDSKKTHQRQQQHQTPRQQSKAKQHRSANRERTNSERKEKDTSLQTSTTAIPFAGLK